MSTLQLGRALAIAAALTFLSPARSSARNKPEDGAPPVAEGAADGVAALLAAADDITRQVVALRGLEARSAIARGVLSRDQIGAKLKARIDKEYTPEEIRTESRILKRLGLLSADADYGKLVVDLLTEQVAGFYDPFARQLYIADWLGLDLQRPALAHEIEHALQDQHFDLKGFATPIKDDGDRQLARSALVEGDGTVVMLEFVAQQLGIDLGKVPDIVNTLGKQLASASLSQSPAFSQAPRFLRETLLFPYFQGMAFVLELKHKAPWSRVDDAFRSPPESSEQILHPEKYLAHERPVAVTPAEVVALAPRKELRRDVLGELEWRVLLASRLEEGEAERAAAGWGGDRLVAYGSPDGKDLPVLVDLATWDTEEDARQAETALRHWLAKGSGQKTTTPGEATVYEADGEASAVERRGRRVLALFGAPSGARQAVADEVWKKWKVADAKGETR